ncbi:MAG: OmpA family protein [Sandaracinaceae bacterium]
MSRICLVLFSLVFVACGGGRASVAVSEDGVDAHAEARTPGGGSVSADASHGWGQGGTSGGAAQTYDASGQPIATATRTGCTEQWVAMPMLINFPTGGTEIDAQNRAILDEMVRTAQSRTDLVAVRVEGHTDTCGHELNNMQLSQMRAQTVAMELVRMGVPRERVQTIGYGSRQPRANERCGRQQDSLSRATNRRVEFSVLVCRAY